MAKKSDAERAKKVKKKRLAALAGPGAEKVVPQLTWSYSSQNGDGPDRKRINETHLYARLSGAGR